MSDMHVCPVALSSPYASHMHTCLDALQVRHNEDKLNTVFSDQVRWPVDHKLCDDPHTKANLLFQAHFSRLPLPIADYVTDTRSVLDNSLRLVQAMIDVAADQGWLSNTLETIYLGQVRGALWSVVSSKIALRFFPPSGSWRSPQERLKTKLYSSVA
jgi:activating signal cointegrator complex subunit 3